MPTPPPDRPAYLGDMRWPQPGEPEVWIGVNGLEIREYRPDTAIVDDLALILSAPVAVDRVPRGKPASAS